MFDISPAALFIGLMAGVVGTAYFIYGKKQTKVMPMLCGALLCVYPWFVQSVLWLLIVGGALMAAPFFVDF